ncbi:MAG TPA: 16S rRNA (guanine(966)-N(2))-methyltransferase RsmD [Dokdonella sp.]
MRRTGRPSKPGTLRIVAGTLRGSRLAVPNVDGLRPTPDRVRETVFNWLAPVVAGAHCLDLYAGTGALGIEALSRGAARCVFVERERALCALLGDNLARLGVGGAEVVEADARGFLDAPPRERFAIAFLDPPFAADLWRDSALALERGGWLQDGAFVYVEAPFDAAPALPPNWRPHRDARAGAVRYALYRRAAADPLS